MDRTAQIVGLYPVDALEPCCLVEVVIRGIDPSDFVAGTRQPNAELPEDYWQVPWDERVIETIVDGSRLVFFLHHVDTSQPLKTPLGALRLPAISPLPEAFASIRYESPC